MDEEKTIYTKNMFIESHYELNLSLFERDLNVDMVNDAYNQLEKISKLKQENSKLIIDNLTQTGGILNSIDSQGALDRAKMTFTSMGHTFPDTIPGPNGQPISTKIFTPELQSTFKNQAQSYMSAKDQLEFLKKQKK